MTITLTAPVKEEALADAIAGALMAQLPAVLAGLEGAYTDGLPLPMPASCYVADMMIDSIQSMPAITVVNRGLKGVDWYEGGGGYHVDIYEFEVDVYVAVQQPHEGYPMEEAAERQALRYHAAMRAVLQATANLTLGGLCRMLRITSSAIHNLRRGGDSIFWRGARLVVEVQTTG